MQGYLGDVLLQVAWSIPIVDSTNFGSDSQAAGPLVASHRSLTALGSYHWPLKLGEFEVKEEISAGTRLTKFCNLSHPGGLLVALVNFGAGDAGLIPPPYG